MAVYFIDYDDGDDSTGDGSVATPWKTPDKAIGSSPAVTLSGSGDKIILKPGVHRGTLQVGVTPTGSSTVEIIGDYDGAYQIAAGSSTPKFGLVDWRAWTDDVTPINTLILDPNGKSYVSVQNIVMRGGKSSSPSTMSITSASTNWTFTNCQFYSTGVATYTSIWIAPPASSMSLAFNRCSFYSPVYNGVGYQIQIRAPLNASEYTMGISFTDCELYGAGVQVVTVGGSGSAWGNGVSFQSCEWNYCLSGVIFTTTVNLATPHTIYDCKFVYSNQNALSASNTTLLLVNGNQHTHGTVYSNVTSGANSRISVCPAVNFNDHRLSGEPLRPFGEPKLVSPFVGLAANYGTISSVDINNRLRPAGFGADTAAAGAYERHDTARKETTEYDVGPACWAFDGPGEHMVPALVNAESTSISVKFKYDSSYGAGTKPQLVMDANPEIGVTTETDTMTAAADTYEALTVGPFTPTAKGWVVLRFVSHSAAAGKVYVDTVS